MRSLILAVLLPACHIAAGASPATHESCSSSLPCPRVTGYSCAAGALTESVLPDGALVHAVVGVFVVEDDSGEAGHDIMIPLGQWQQDTDGILLYDCPTVTLDGARGGNVLVYYYET